jgi:hypothetical protein
VLALLPDQTLIPAILHYCWFGTSPEPHAELRTQWKVLHPHAEIVRWDESTAPTEHPYLAAVLTQGWYSKAADFMRLWLMVHHGGIYLDADVECLRSLDPLRTRPFFAGFQRERGFDPYECVNSAVIGARQGHWVAAELMRRLLERDDGSRSPMESGPRLLSGLLVDLGLERSDEEVRLEVPGRDPIHVLPRHAFYPYSWEETPDAARLRADTFAVHRWDGSWMPAWREVRARQLARQRGA